MPAHSIFPAQHLRFGNTGVRLIAAITTLTSLSLGGVALAQTLAVDSDFGIHLSSLVLKESIVSGDLVYTGSNWQLLGIEPVQLADDSQAAASFEGLTLTLHCVIYAGESYLATFNQSATDEHGPYFDLINAQSNPGCASDLNVVPTLFPSVVSPYEMEDTSVLLAQAESQLRDLSIDDFFDQSFALLRHRDPEQVMIDGDLEAFTLETASLGNISDEFYFQTKAIQSLVRTLLLGYDRDSLSEEDQLSYDIYLDHLDKELEWAEYRDFEYPATYGMFGWPGSTESFFSRLFVFSNAREAQLYLALLNQVDRRFQQIGELLAARQNAGIVEPSLTLGFSHSLVSSLGSMAATETVYYQAFDERLASLGNVSAAEKTILREQLVQIIETKVKPAYRALAGQMQDLLQVAPANIGFGQFPGGDKFYEFTIRYYTSSDMTPDDVYLLGLRELARIHDEMDVLFNRLGFPGSESLAQKITRVDEEAGIVPATQSRQFFEELIAETYTRLDAVFSVLPQQRVVVEDDMFGGFYIAGSDDGTRPGAFYANTNSDQPYTTLPSLTYHEAVPGHHLQIALAQELDLPEFRKKQRLTSYTEGWALYAERLASDLGWYENDIYGELGRLQFEALRAARLVIDTGIHARGWTYSEADSSHIFNVGYPGPISRYSVWPGQATAYTTGMLKILELRERAEAELGNLYDIRDFHAAVIGNGSMPLHILEQVVDRYIAKKSASTTAP